MHVQFGQGSTEYGPGVDIVLDENEVASAILAYLVAHEIYVRGPLTVITQQGQPKPGTQVLPIRVYVDPSGCVVAGGKRYNGDTGTIDE